MKTTATLHSNEPDPRWRSVLDRNRDADGAFVYGVQSTGIYCRPSCPSRRPANSSRVQFFDIPEAAERAGFRACLRCKPETIEVVDPTLSSIRDVCAAIDVADEEVPGLDVLAGVAGWSAHHLQRTFKRIMGISPKAYGDARKLARFKHGVKQGEDVTQAMYGAGYGSSSRLYETASEKLGMTPASYAKGGKGATIVYTIRPCLLGLVLIAATEKGIAMIGFDDTEHALEHELHADFPEATILRDEAGLGPWVDPVLAYLKGAEPPHDLPLDIRATAFQWRVWRELMRIPAGQTRTYGEIAARLGQPKAARAVGRACATNPVSITIPCHRAVGADGSLTGYRWGKDRKARLLADEKSFAKRQGD